MARQQTLIVPKPHSHKQKMIMQSLFCHGITEVWVACGTKFGKSFAGGACLSSRAFVTQGGLFRWVAPIYSQTKIGLKYCQKILPKELITVNRGEPSIYIPDKETTIEFKSGKYPEDLEGETINGYCLDECAKMTEQVYDSAKTTVTISRGPIIAFSTPRGKNWFYNKCMAAKNEMEWSIKNGIQPSRIFITAPSIDNPAVTKEAVEDARRNLPDRLFRQYYLAEFMDDGSVFINYRQCVKSDIPIQFDGPTQFWFHSDASKLDVVIGVDWAKHKDFTVFTAIDYLSGKRRIVGFMRFQGIPYTQAVRELYIFCKKFKEVGTVWHDKTGVGDAIDDLMSSLPIPYNGIIFTNSSKSNMVNILGMSFEKEEIELPNWGTLIDELDSFEVTVSESGNMKYAAAKGLHDDIVFSLCLANQAAVEYAGTGMEIRFLEELGTSKSNLTLDRFYRDLIDDDDDDIGGAAFF